MAGSIRNKGKPGVWELRVYAGVVDGKKRWVERTFRGSEREARKALARLVVEVDDGHEQVTPRTHVEDPPLRVWLDEWWDRRAPEWSPTSAATARGHIDRHISPTLGDITVRALSVRDIQEWLIELREKGLAPATRVRIFGVLRSALEQAERWEVIDRNPAARVDLPRVPYEEPRWPTASDLAAAIHAAPDIHVRTLVWLAAATGGRRGQLVALRWSDLSLDEQVLTFHTAAVAVPGGVKIKAPKGGRPIRVPLDELTVDVIRTYRAHRVETALAAGVGKLEECSFVFARDPAGTQCWYPDRPSKMWARLRDQVPELEGMRLHDLRHAHATLLIAQGVDRRVVADRLGHAQVSTTDRYTHRVTEADRRAAEIVGQILAGAV